jgi:hypothetical protein
MDRRAGSIVEVEGVMPRIKVWGRVLKRDSSASVRMVVLGEGLCFGWEQEMSSRIRMS